MGPPRGERAPPRRAADRLARLEQGGGRLQVGGAETLLELVVEVPQAGADRVGWRGIVQAAAVALLWLLGGYPYIFTPGQFGFLVLMTLVRTVINFYIFALFLYVILSWIAPGTNSPGAALIDSLCEPILRPVRRLIPPLGGFDLSALFVIIALQALNIAIT